MPFINELSSSAIDRAVESLRRTRASINCVEAPAEGGVYAIYLSTPSLLAPFPEGEDGLIYIGLSMQLCDREFDQHFASSGSGFSTLRRSLGSLMKNQLSLRAIPRASGISESNVRNYCFETECEDTLTRWIHK